MARFRPGSGQLFRARFHTAPRPGESRRCYGTFEQDLDPAFAGRYYYFEILEGIENPFERPCASGLDWYLGTRPLGPGLNHELNGQSYARVEDVEASLFFGIPSAKFTALPVIPSILQRDRRSLKAVAGGFSSPGRCPARATSPPACPRAGAPGPAS